MVLFLVVLVGQGGCYLDRFDRLGDLSRRGHRRVSAVKERPFSSRRDGMRFHNPHSTDSVVDVRFPLIGVFGSVARSRYSHRGPGLAVCEPMIALLSTPSVILFNVLWWRHRTNNLRSE